MNATFAQFWAGLRILLVMTVLLGLAYPLVLTGFAQVAVPGRADGSIVERDGKPVGSSLIGQSFADDPSYFQSRPSAAGDGYDPLASSASNLGPESPDLLQLIADRRAAAAELDGTAPADVAPDALTASASGLDPHISPEYAAQQVARVARERGLSEDVVRRLVEQHTTERTLGFLGEPRVNVLELNLALDARD
ncbi:potassium-transporting ATPase subunit KdpC [Nocardioides islandensis]|uniref:Potassium-transporting ATPase KdpC subunit n=1 Tax=Nocardioides islandensis TaxID=433663 RepID=A0A930YF16_9ACTN|nr:potassium-transporting ATPase subunit KdpC [Nocardioides islandensis]MBF4764427.1 potassium-transporting ATPase subunit KdpC [Nocardioides islandensis]